MPQNPIAQQTRNRRRAFAAAFLCAAALATLTWGALASLAQGGGRSRQQQQQGQTQQGAAQNQPKLKLTPLRSSESDKGSRVTITGTQSLGDYQSYRSGERFYVRIPNADAGAVRSGVRGRGFEDAQVQKSGGDVILSFRVQPGARPSVKQRFNQLDVEFAAPEGAGNSSAGQQQRPASQQQTNTERPASSETSAATQRTPASQQQTSPDDADARRAAERAQSSRQTETSLPPTAGLPGQTPAPQQSAQQTTNTTTSPAPSPAAQTTELAQARPPEQGASSTTTTTATAPVSTSLGATVARNWKPLGILAALLIVGLGFFFASRRASAKPRPPQVAAEALAEAKTEKLKESPAAVVAAAPVVTKDAATTTAVSPAPATGKKKARVKGARTTAEAVAPVTEKSAEVREEKSAAAETSAAPKQSPKEAAAVVSPEPVAAGKVEEVTAVAPVVGSADLAPAVETSTAVAPVAFFDSDVVQSETRNLLEGEAYDSAVLASGDRTTRQMIAAELLAALAARNPARKERARTAFIEHGYFNEAARDLREAEAPAERASAARSLGLVGDRLATEHLSSALEDTSVEVRRAAVEALASVRDPEAVAALESLLAREKSSKTKVPRKVVQRAIEACADAPAEAPSTLAATTAATILATETTQASATETLAAPEAETAAAPADETVSSPEPVTSIEAVTTPEAEAEDATAEVAAVTLVEEATPTLAEDATPTFIEEATPTLVEEVTPTLVERADETLVEEPSPTLADVATPTLFEGATPTVAEMPTVEAAEVEVEAAQAEVEAPFEGKAIEPVPAAFVEEEIVAEEAAEAAPELFAPVEREARETVEVAPFVAPEEALELEPEADETGLVPVEESAPRAGVAEGPDEWVELDFGVTESTPSQLAATRATQPAEYEAYTEELFTPIVGEPARETRPAPAKEIEAAPAASTAIEAVPEVEADLVTELTLAAPGPAVETGLTSAVPPAAKEEKGVAAYTEEDYSTVPKVIRDRLTSDAVDDRAEAVKELARVESGEAFEVICAGFDDPAADVRSAAARSLYEMQDDRAESFTRALRGATPQRRRNIGAAIASSGLASEAISNLTGESRDKTYDAFSLLFLMAKAGEVQPLVRAVEGHPDSEVRLAVVKLLALSGQKDILPAFRRLAVRGTLPAEVRSAVMEAIYQISSQETQTVNRQS